MAWRRSLYSSHLLLQSLQEFWLSSSLLTLDETDQKFLACLPCQKAAKIASCSFKSIISWLKDSFLAVKKKKKKKSNPLCLVKSCNLQHESPHDSHHLYVSGQCLPLTTWAFDVRGATCKWWFFFGILVHRTLWVSRVPKGCRWMGHALPWELTIWKVFFHFHRQIEWALLGIFGHESYLITTVVLTGH